MRYLEFADTDSLRRVERALAALYLSTALPDRTVRGIPVATITTSLVRTRQHPDFPGGILDIPEAFLPLLSQVVAFDPRIRPADVNSRSLTEVTPAVRARTGLDRLLEGPALAVVTTPVVR